MTTISCAYSDRISCKTAHKPICGGTGGSGSGEVPKYIETFVDTIATIISMIKGTAITRVSNPAMSSSPPTISSPPTKFAVSAGAGKPSLVNRPTP
jgi:hypothetical protein